MNRCAVFAGFIVRRCQRNSLAAPVTFCRAFSTTCLKRLREIHESREENSVVIEGVKVESERANKLLQTGHKGCPLCSLKLDVKYTDVLILSQFLRPDGCLLPRHITGVCMKQQKKLEKLVNQAQRAGLLPTFRPDLPNGKTRTTIQSQYKWKKYNVFYEDD